MRSRLAQTQHPGIVEIGKQRRDPHRAHHVADQGAPPQDVDLGLRRPQTVDRQDRRTLDDVLITRLLGIEQHQKPGLGLVTDRAEPCGDTGGGKGHQEHDDHDPPVIRRHDQQVAKRVRGLAASAGALAALLVISHHKRHSKPAVERLRYRGSINTRSVLRQIGLCRGGQRSIIADRGLPAQLLGMFTVT